MVEPDDIPASLVESLIKRRFVPGIRENLAATLSAAIEAGVVSPPCHCLRWDGELQMQDFADVPKVFVGRPWSKDTEHYKGQKK